MIISRMQIFRNSKKGFLKKYKYSCLSSKSNFSRFNTKEGNFPKYLQTFLSQFKILHNRKNNKFKFFHNWTHNKLKSFHNWTHNKFYKNHS